MTSALLDDYRAALAALSAVSRAVADYQAADEATLLELNGLAARQRQLVDTQQALVAGEIAHRSAPALGNSGLAQRAGFRSVEEFLRATTQSSARDAGTSARVGRLLREAATDGSPDPSTGEVLAASRPWLADVARGVAEARLSVAAAEAIGSGLGRPTDDIGPAALAAAARELIALAASLDPDRLYRRARQLRDDLDTAGVADRENARYLSRGLRHFDLPNGMGRLTWDLDPATNAVVKQIFERATGPRRGGVRFVSGENKEKADRILADPRSTAQLASDVFLALLQAGSDADSSQLLGSGAASVRILVTVGELGGRVEGVEGVVSAAGSRDGVGHIEGEADPISRASVEQYICSGTQTPILFSSDGQPLDVGREQRLFTPKQRIALAARDGGCIVGVCGRPPNQTEAHHIRFWDRDGGATNVEDGVLLCPFRHKLFHNNHWEIERVGAAYLLIPPVGIDPQQRPIPAVSTSAAMRDLRREEAERQRGAPPDGRGDS